MSNANPRPVLEFENLSAGYHGGTVLHDISLRIAQGETHAIVGHNGAGKSTLANTAIGLVQAYAGRVLFDGADVTRFKTHRRARAGMAFVPQGRRVFASVTVGEHLAISFGKRDSRSARWTPGAVLELFPRLAERRSHHGSQLSGGEQQMLAIARALLTNPRLLIVDEPTEGLAPTVVDSIHNVMSTLRSEGMTILLAVPQPEWPVVLADRVSVLCAGKNIADYVGDDLRQDSTPLVESLAIAPDSYSGAVT